MRWTHDQDERNGALKSWRRWRMSLPEFLRGGAAACRCHVRVKFKDYETRSRVRAANLRNGGERKLFAAATAMACH